MHLDVPWLIQNELGSIYTHTFNGRNRKREGNLARAVVLIWWLPSLIGSDVGTVRRLSAGIHSETKKNADVEASPHTSTPCPLEQPLGLNRASVCVFWLWLMGPWELLPLSLCCFLTFTEQWESPALSFFSGGGSTPIFSSVHISASGACFLS